MNKLRSNKKGASLTGWVEGISLSMLFVLILSMLIGEFNLMYGENHNVGLSTNSTDLALKNYEGTLESQINEGEVDFDAETGITLKSSWGIVNNAVNMIWTFITGGWIYDITDMMNMPIAVARTFITLYFLSIGFVVLAILFKVKNP